MEFNGLTDSLGSFLNAFHKGAIALAPYSGRLLSVFISIDIVLAGAFTSLGKHNAATLLEKGLFLGGWFWLTKNFGTLAVKFVNSLVAAGLIAGGQSGAFSGADHQLLHDPSRIAAYGLRVSAPILALAENAGVLDGFDMFVFWACYIGIMVGYLLMAIQVTLSVLEFHLRLTLTSILLPFGIWGHTRFIGEKAIGSIIGSGVKLMVLAFILAVADPLMEKHIRDAAAVGSNMNFNQLWAAVLSSGFFVLLVFTAPSIAAGLLSGAPALSAAGAAQAAVTGAGVAAAGGAAALAATRLAAGAGGAMAKGGAHVLGSAAAGAKMGAAAGAISGGPVGAVAAGAAGALKGAGGAVYGGLKSAAGKAAGAVSQGPKAAFQQGAEAFKARGQADAPKDAPAGAAAGANTNAEWSAAAGGYSRPSSNAGPAPGAPVRVGAPGHRVGSHQLDGAADVDSMAGASGSGQNGPTSPPAAPAAADAATEHVASGVADEAPPAEAPVGAADSAEARMAAPFAQTEAPAPVAMAQSAPEWARVLHQSMGASLSQTAAPAWAGVVSESISRGKTAKKNLDRVQQPTA
jgi:type IV secretion system protein TrbL